MTSLVQLTLIMFSLLCSFIKCHFPKKVVYYNYEKNSTGKFTYKFYIMGHYLVKKRRFFLVIVSFISQILEKSLILFMYVSLNLINYLLG